MWCWVHTDMSASRLSILFIIIIIGTDVSAPGKSFPFIIIIIITPMNFLFIISILMFASSTNFLFYSIHITDISASGMNFLFMGVSRVMGRMPRAQLLEGRPDPGLPRLGESCRIVLVSWC